MAAVAKNFLLDLLAAAGDVGIEVAALVDAATVMGVQPNAARVALSRLKHSGLVICDRRGAYRIAADAPGVHPALSRWRAPKQHLRRWSGRWSAVMLDVKGPTSRVARRAQSRALRLHGLAEWRNAVCVRPDNLRGGLERLHAGLVRAGLDANTPVFELGEAPFEPTELYDVDALERGYRQGRQRLEEARSKLTKMPLRRAAARAFELGNEALKKLAFDPWLPEELCDTRARSRFIAAVLDHDERSRRLWSEILGASLHTDTAARKGRETTSLSTRSAQL